MFNVCFLTRALNNLNANISRIRSRRDVYKVYFLCNKYTPEQKSCLDKKI